MKKKQKKEGFTRLEFYNREIKDLYREFHSSKNGITNIRAELSLGKYGLNQLRELKKISPLTIFFRQFQSFIIYILIGAFLISLALGFIHDNPEDKFDSFVDAGVILIILIGNAILGFVQEYRAEKSIEALKKLANCKN